MLSHRITCINKPNRLSAHEHITHIGSSVDGKKWTRELAIKLIEAKTDSFHVTTGGNRSEVGVVYPKDGRHSYLRTHADGKWNDNLLALPEC